MVTAPVMIPDNCYSANDCANNSANIIEKIDTLYVTADGNFILDRCSTKENPVLCNTFKIFKTSESTPATVAHIFRDSHGKFSCAKPTRSTDDVELPYRACEWILKRLNSWPREFTSDHDPKSKGCWKFLDMQPDVVKNATILIRIGHVYVDSAGKVKCYSLYHASDPVYKMVAKIIESSEMVTIYSKNEKIADIYVDGSSRTSCYIGCQSTSKEEVRRMCRLVTERISSSDLFDHKMSDQSLFRQDSGSCRPPSLTKSMSVKLLINVADVGMDLNKGKVFVQRVTYSDDASLSVYEQFQDGLANFPQAFSQDFLYEKKSTHVALLYVDHPGQVYVNCSPEYVTLIPKLFINWKSDMTQLDEPILGNSNFSTPELVVHVDKMGNYVLSGFFPNELVYDIVATFNMFKTLAEKPEKKLATLQISGQSGVIRFQFDPAATSSQQDLIGWIIERFNQWPRDVKWTHFARPSSQNLCMANDAVKNAGILTLIGKMFVDTDQKTKCHPCSSWESHPLYQKLAFILNGKSFHTGGIYGQVANIYMDQTEDVCYIGCVERIKNHVRKICMDVAIAYNNDAIHFGTSNLKAKVMINVVKAHVTPCAKKVSIDRIDCSDNSSMMVLEQLRSLLGEPTLDAPAPKADQVLQAYVDRASRHYVYCNPEFDFLGIGKLFVNWSCFETEQCPTRRVGLFHSQSGLCPFVGSTAPECLQEPVTKRPKCSNCDNVIVYDTTISDAQAVSPSKSATSVVNQTSVVVSEQGNDDDVKTKQLAQIYSNLNGDFCVTGCNDKDLAERINSIFWAFGTRPKFTAIASLMGDENLNSLSLVPTTIASHGVQSGCKWIIDRYNAWPKNVNSTFYSWSADPDLFMKEYAVRNAYILTKIGHLRLIGNDGILKFESHKDTESERWSTPFAERMSKKMIHIAATTKYPDQDAWLVGYIATVYMDPTNKTCYIGCTAGGQRQNLIRATCKNIVHAFNNADFDTDLTAKLLVNVACARVENINNILGFQFKRWEDSDDCSLMIFDQMKALLDPFMRGTPRVGPENIATLYVDQICQVFVYCSSRPEFEPIVNLFSQYKVQAVPMTQTGNPIDTDVSESDKSDKTGKIEEPQAPEKTELISVDKSASADYVPPRVMSEENKLNDLKLFFATFEGESSSNIRFANEKDQRSALDIDWANVLAFSITKQPLHVLEEIFARAQGKMKIGTPKKIELLEKCLKDKNVEKTKLLLKEFDMDAQTMATCNVKWGNLSVFDPQFCKYLIETYDLPRTVLSTPGDLFEIKSVDVLRWITDRFGYNKNGFKGSSAVYETVRGYLRWNALDVFKEFIVIFSGIISKECVPKFINANMDSNLLLDSLEQNKFEHFDFLVQHYQVSKAMLWALLKAMIIAKPDNYWNPTILQHLINATR